MQFIETLRRAFQLPDLRRRLLFTLAMFAVYRLVAFIPVPGINTQALQQLFSQPGSLFNFLNLFAGGAISRFSLVAMGIMPYINASIILQLLTIVIPRLEELSKEGEEGRRKMTRYTRYGTVLLAFLQAVGTTFLIRNYGAIQVFDWQQVAFIAISLTAGTVFLMWIGEQITENGIGNGISLIIFAGIVSRLPGGLGNISRLIQAGTLNFFVVAIFLVFGLLVIAGIVLVQEGERRIPVRYAKRVVGRKLMGGQSTHIPIKVNPAGVIPVIFAASVLAFPPTIAQFFHGSIATTIVNLLSPGKPLYLVLYAIFIIFFSYFYTAVQYNPRDMADNIKKNGGFIPGIRPGRPTSDYIDRLLVRITLVGAIFLAAVSVLPYLIRFAINVQSIYFGGTSLIIVVGVALQTMKQVEAHLMMRHYKGFIR